jgi:L-alanine-DL-glutamate epimerase-like enolase superfamily enzyme
MKIVSIEIFALREPEAREERHWWGTSPLDVLYGSETPRLERRMPGQEGNDQITNVVVVIHCENGLYGLGNVGVGSAASVGVIEEVLSPLLIGRDIFQIELIWKNMYLNTLNLGRKGLVIQAISAVDIALWDVRGKLLNQPVYNLLGGLVKTRVKAYASQCYATENLESLSAEAEKYVTQGYTALKMRFGYGPAEGLQGMRANYQLVKTIRETVGDSVEIAGEAYMGWDTNYAIRMIKMLENLNLAWLEEPVGPDSLESYAEIRRKVGTPISGGEHEYTLEGFHAILKAKAVDILQPDMNRMGGITAGQKVLALAEAYEVPVIPHSNQSHNSHLIFSSLNCPLIESFPEDGIRTGYNFYYEFFTGEPRASNGYVEPSKLPGLGIELNRNVIDTYLKRHVYIGETSNNRFGSFQTHAKS